MAYRELLPPAALRASVDRFWVRVPGAGAPPAPARILPDGCIDVVIDADSGEARVVGTMTSAVVYEAPTARLAAVRFRPGGAHPFLRITSAELTDQVVSVAALGARWLEVGAGAPEQLLEPLATALLRRQGRTVDERVRLGVRRLLSTHPPRVAELARELGLSRQQLARVFREHVGVGPKELARIGRMQRAIDHLQRCDSQSLAAAALELGYYDQAHMARELRELAGITPLRARGAPRSISPIRSLWREA